MIKEIKGNLLDTHCKLIAHGVNCQGVMGSGVAKALYEKWPEVKTQYLAYYNDTDWVVEPDEYLGLVHFAYLSSNLIVANCFTQQNYGTDGQVYLNYTALDQCLETLKERSFVTEMHEIAMPKIGCGLAGGDWNKVRTMIEDRFRNSNITIYVYSLE